jgi:hypothetical protein
MENRDNEDHHRATEHTYSSHQRMWTHLGTVSCHMWWAWNSHSIDPCNHQYSCTQTCPSHWCTFRHAGMGLTHTHQYQHHIWSKEKHFSYIYLSITRQTPYRPDQLWGPPSFLSKWYQGVKLTTDLHQVLRSTMVALYLHSPICLHGIVLNKLNTGMTLPLLWEEPVLCIGYGCFPCISVVYLMMLQSLWT